MGLSKFFKKPPTFLLRVDRSIGIIWRTALILVIKFQVVIRIITVFSWEQGEFFEMHFALRLSFEGTTVNLPDSGLNREVLVSGASLKLENHGSCQHIQQFKRKSC